MHDSYQTIVMPHPLYFFKTAIDKLIHDTRYVLINSETKQGIAALFFKDDKEELEACFNKIKKIEPNFRWGAKGTLNLDGTVEDIMKNNNRQQPQPTVNT